MTSGQLPSKVLNVKCACKGDSQDSQTTPDVWSSPPPHPSFCLVACPFNQWYNLSNHMVVKLAILGNTFLVHQLPQGQLHVVSIRTGYVMLRCHEMSGFSHSIYWTLSCRRDNIVGSVKPGCCSSKQFAGEYVLDRMWVTAKCDEHNKYWGHHANLPLMTVCTLLTTHLPGLQIWTLNLLPWEKWLIQTSSVDLVTHFDSQGVLMFSTMA